MGPHNKGEDLCNLLPLTDSPGLQRAFPVLLRLDSKIDFFEKYNVHTYIDLFMVSVDRAYRQQGLGTELYSRALCLLKTKGYSVAKCIFTSPYSQRIGRKMGFQELCSEKFIDFIDYQTSNPKVPIVVKQTPSLPGLAILQCSNKIF